MTPLEAVKKMQAVEPYAGMDAFGSSVCGFCGTGYGSEHKPDCPVPMLPQIVKALEILERMVTVHERQDYAGYWSEMETASREYRALESESAAV